LNPFEQKALALFRHQATENPVYRAFIKALGRDINTISSIDNIPFLPISFFKSHEVKTGQWEPELVFTSSGTSGMVTSMHPCRSLDHYLLHTETCFRQFFGPLEGTVVLCLLPSYMEREGSSLIYMAEYFVEKSKEEASGFYLYDHQGLQEQINALHGFGKRILLLGVTFALLDFAEKFSVDVPELIVMETGGMKGRRKEMLREEVHRLLKKAFHLPAVYSEYGMTELMSQAYSIGEGRFRCPASMRVLLRDVNDPFDFKPSRGYGGINIIDLANEHSCAFIETQDLGRLHPDGSFEVLGRFDHADIRGCNLLVQ
jgi:phenylacetate-coenzyme A ligase PaaK-like adenylate-forming protein